MSIGVSADQAAELVAAAAASIKAFDPRQAKDPVAVNVDWHLNTIAADPRYARAVAVLPRLISHLSRASAEAPDIVLRDQARRSEEFTAWIEHGTPMVNA